MTFGAYLKHLRIERRITLRVMCCATGLDPCAYSRIERGTAPPPSALGVLLEGLGIPPQSEKAANLYWLAGQWQPPPPPTEAWKPNRERWA